MTLLAATIGQRAGLVDTFGRIATDLRVSLTDRCNLRCTYCMPAEGMTWLPHDDLLTDAEVSRLVRVAVSLLGVTSVRFTGGEPLLRPGLAAIVGSARSNGAHLDLALTTNGIGLERHVDALVAAGLSRLNVSLDTLRPERFRALSRRDRLEDVLRGLQAARAAGIGPVKVNAVMMRGVNDDEPLELLRYCLERGYELRFIEQMPLDADRAWQRSNVVSAEEILARLADGVELKPVPQPRGSAPAERWLVNGGPATVGVIASVTQPFCRACDRTRLTADGQVRSCLFSTRESDLRDLLRRGADDETLAQRWREAMWGKAAGHGIGEGGSGNAATDTGFAPASRTMSAIGG